MNSVNRSASFARLVASLGALAVLLAGCGLFDPEDPPTPGGGQAVNLPNLTGGSPESTLYSLEVGLETKSLQLYQHALAESTVASDISFHAFFDPQDLADYSQSATPPTDWTTPDEKTFFSQLASLIPVSSYELALSEDENRADIPGPDEQTLYRHYRLTYAPNQFLAVGLADLTFRRVGVNQEWKLTRWIDRRDTTVFSLRTMGRQRLGPPSP